MTDVQSLTMPPLSNLPRVELLQAGQWDLSSGRAYFTTDDLANAVAAISCPAVRRPVLKIGHTDQRFNDPRNDGEPTLGWIGNMATTNNGQTLVGDYMGMPGWLGEILASAYPDRSIEGQYDFICQIGHLHPFVLTGLALLGVTPPGVGTLNSLQDVAELYGVTASEATEVTGTSFNVTVHAAAATSVSTGAMVALIPTDADAQRLAVDGGEPVDELHVTLRYLGKAADIDDADQQRIVDTITAIAAQTAPVDGDGFSVALFNPTNTDRPTCIALGINGAGLDTIHTAVEDAVDALGIDMPDAHLPWAAHLTLIYTDDATQVTALVDRTGPIVFDRLRIAFAGVATDIPLGGAPVAASRKDSTMPNPKPREVAAGVSTDDVRREYYEDAPYSMWITEMQLEPLQLIVCDDNAGKTYRVAVTVNGEDITFALPVEVSIQYIDKPAAPVAAGAAAPATRLVYASRAESRPIRAGSEPTAEPGTDAGAPPADPVQDDQAPAPEPTTPPTTEEDAVSTNLTEVRSRLGLADDVDDAGVLSHLDALVAKSVEPPAETPVAAASLPAGVVAIEESVLTELREKAEAGVAARAQQLTDARDRLISDAINAGKIAPARVAHWQTAYAADAEGTKTTLASLAPGLIPVAATGYADTEGPDNEEHVFDGMFPPSTDEPKGA